MAKGVISNGGLSIPTYEEIKEDNAEQIRNDVGVPIDTSDNSIAGILNTLISAATIDQYELIQAIYKNLDINTASGVYLDTLARYRGIQRKGQTQTTGTEVFKRTYASGLITVPTNTIVSDGKNNYKVNQSLSITEDNAHYIEIYLQDDGNTSSPLMPLNDNAVYFFSVNGYGISYTAMVGESLDVVCDGIVASLAGNTIASGLVSAEALLDDDNNKRIVRIKAINTDSRNIVWVSGAKVDLKSYVASPINISNVVYGSIPAAANTVTTLSSGVNGVVEVFNPYPLLTGDSRETDAELRTRLTTTRSGTGSGTLESIITAVKEVQGVGYVAGRQNITQDVDSQNLPPKSFQIIVSGSASSEDIAKAILSKAPAGILSYGDTTVQVKDSYGNEYSINYSTPQPLVFQLDISWSATRTLSASERELVEGLIKQSVSAVVGSLDIGQNVSAGLFYRAVYSASSLVNTVDIELKTEAGDVVNVLCIDVDGVGSLAEDGISFVYSIPFCS